MDTSQKLESKRREAINTQYRLIHKALSKIAANSSRALNDVQYSGLGEPAQGSHLESVRTAGIGFRM